MTYSITQNGKPLDKSKYTIDTKNKTFSTKEDNLVLDFSNEYEWSFNTCSGCTFNTCSDCTFKTGDYCTFRTGSGCTFKTGRSCTFNTYYNCTFKTGSDCTFKTEDNCTFKTGSDCTFKTEDNCTFNTGRNCTFNTGYGCTFNTGYGCTFKTDSECTFNIFGSFKSIKTKGNSTILVRDRKIHDYIEDEVVVYFQEGKLLYTENKVSKESYLTMKELVS